MSSKGNDTKVSKQKKGKKTGPKGAYAVKKIIDRMSDGEKSLLRKSYYLDHTPKCRIAKEIGISHQLVNKLLEEVGPLVPSDLSS